MSDKFQENAEKAAAFQKIWAESLNKTAQAAWTSFSSGNSPPPEVLREMRAGLFEALAQSWEQFMRSPEFLEVMRQWMEQTISVRKTTNDLVARVRKEAQAPSMEDIENIMLAVRHMEKRLLDRMDEVSRQIIARQNGGKEPGASAENFVRGGRPKRASEGRTKMPRRRPAARKHGKAEK